ncbi:MAG: hypothetical protein M3416_16995 [Acidobacteriota bacterium]|nr:hypothetical protein [Acidobacteriota bacterium]
MPIIGWIRDLFGIQKDMYETKKTRLEIEKIEGEKREKLITPATLDDVKKYDPKIMRIERRIRAKGLLRPILRIIRLARKLAYYRNKQRL